MIYNLHIYAIIQYVREKEFVNTHSKTFFLSLKVSGLNNLAQSGIKAFKLRKETLNKQSCKCSSAQFIYIFFLSDFFMFSCFHIFVIFSLCMLIFLFFSFFSCILQFVTQICNDEEHLMFKSNNKRIELTEKQCCAGVFCLDGRNAGLNWAPLRYCGTIMEKTIRIDASHVISMNNNI